MFNVLMTSAGRRVELLHAFREALNGRGNIFAADCDPTAPTLFAADRAGLLPMVSDPHYVEALLQMCRDWGINLVVPLIDPELLILAEKRDLFLARNIVLAVSNEQSIAIANDKLRTAQFFDDIGVPTPVTFDIREYLHDGEVQGLLQFPVIVKPRTGSGGKQVSVCRDHSEVIYCSSKLREDDCVVQEYLTGNEITIDVLSNGHGDLIEMVPRQRLKTRGGEVERGVTIDCDDFVCFVQSIVAALNPYGVINLQCFYTPQGPIFTEINARFGGGYPLAHVAGARFPELLIDLAIGKTVIPRVGHYKRNILMTRYDSAFYAYIDDVCAKNWDNIICSKC